MNDDLDGNSLRSAVLPLQLKPRRGTILTAHAGSCRVGAYGHTYMQPTLACPKRKTVTHSHDCLASHGGLSCNELGCSFFHR